MYNIYTENDAKITLMEIPDILSEITCDSAISFRESFY